jgi:MFS transporter, DHA1 family, tetracycline resistance protein
MSLIVTPGKRPANGGMALTTPLFLYSPGPSPNPIDNDGLRSDGDLQRWRHLYVLPVLLLEFLALALTRAVLPSLLLNEYGNRVYLVMGCADFVRGFLAFFTCPIVGRISDVVGRRLCLFITVLGTCAPVCSLALFSWKQVALPRAENHIPDPSLEAAVSEEHSIWPWSTPYSGKETHPMAIAVFIVLFSLSGIFASTFTLVFAYISDTVKEQDERVSAYGLALATFGLSFTLGPMIGGYLAKTDTQYVFLTSLFLTVLDLLYIYLWLPESRVLSQNKDDNLNHNSHSAAASFISMDHKFSWNPVDTLRIIVVDPFLRQVGKVAFLYYTGLWALISTLSVYAVKRFHLTPERLGELISVLGLSTMIAEAALVRILVPLLGEKRAMKLGLVSFALQCLTLGFAYEGWHLFVCAAFSLLGNLVYPSLTSLVSGSVEPDAVGEALGAINGIKALTEGIGPLVFGTLMTISEKSALPGWPYLLAAILVVAAYQEAGKLPDIDDDDFLHELSRKNRKRATGSFLMRTFAPSSEKTAKKSRQDDELDGLLSEVDESWEEEEEAVQL